MSTINLQNATAIGFGAVVNASNKVLIGNSSVTVIGGQVGWSTFSDGRFKENIKENVPGLDFITRLKPVTYTLNIDKLNDHLSQNMTSEARQAFLGHHSNVSASATLHTGFVAQEVEKVAQQLGYSFDGVSIPTNNTDNYSLNYSQFVVPLVKAVQEQQVMINVQKEKIETLQQQMDLLQKSVDQLKKLIQH